MSDTTVVDEPKDAGAQVDEIKASNERSEAAARAEAHAASIEAEALGETETIDQWSIGTSGVPLTVSTTNQTVISEPPPPVKGIVSAGYSDMDFFRAEQAPLEMILGKPWAITREAAIEAATRIAMLTNAGVSRDVLAQAEAALQRPTANRPTKDGGSVAVIPLRGTITPRGSLFSLMFGGGGGLQAFRAQFKDAVADGNVSAIVLDIDSPGGLIDLVTETASDVFKARGSKPIVAVANTCTASAAYWIASQADSIVSTPSGMVGSVGVFTIHEDYSKMEAMMGIKTTLISAGDHKTDGNPYQPLSKAALQSIQGEVDEIYDMFTAQIAEGRGVSQKVVQAGYGRGRCMLASEAFKVGMIDRVDTLEATIARLGGGASDPTPQPGDLLDAAGDDDGVSASMEALNATLEDGDAHMADLADALTDNLASLTGAQVSATDVDYLNSEALREQPAWHL